MKSVLKKCFTGLLVVMFTLAIVNAQMVTKKMLPDACYVPDKKTAIKIAEAVWLPIYGDKIFDKRPFVANLKDDSVWVVQGTIKSGKGGVPYIEIQKSDCKIIKVTHGK